MAKMPAKVLDHMKSRPAPKKGGNVPPALKKWNNAHPNAKNSHKS